jgi:hypothetical protein
MVILFIGAPYGFEVKEVEVHVGNILLNEVNGDVVLRMRKRAVLSILALSLLRQI